MWKKLFIKKKLNRHIREKHLKSSLKRCPYCFKCYPRIKDHLLRCKHGIFSKLYSFSEKYKIYKIKKDKKLSALPPKIVKLKKDFSDNYIAFVNQNSGIEEKYKYINSTIGEGSFSKVYIGIDNNNNISVAIKYLKEENAKKKLLILKSIFWKSFKMKIFFLGFFIQNSIKKIKS